MEDNNKILEETNSEIHKNTEPIKIEEPIETPEPVPLSEPTDEKNIQKTPLEEDESICEEVEAKKELTQEVLKEEKENTNFVLAFKAIHTFILSLNEEFGVKNKPLRLYARLVEQTKFTHELPIKKHVKAFADFCISNREAIFVKNFEKFTNDKVSYSERVFLKMKDLFKLADKDQKNVMWQHILTISALVDSAGRAKQILKENNNGSKETDFLTDIIEKVEKNIDLDNMSNPFEAIGQIMSSGIFTDLISSMNEQVSSGQLDMTKMLSAVQGLVGNISKDQPEMGQMIDGFMKNMPNMPNMPK